MEKICIIKLGAKGDVIRTLSILPALKEKYPCAEITWITKPNIVEIVKSNSMIKQAISTPVLKQLEKFDILYNLDIDEEATKLANEIEADKKLGFCMKDGFPYALNEGAEYYINTIFDDELKKTNKKTYQEMIFEAMELKFDREKHKIKIALDKKSIEYAERFAEENKIEKEKLIGVHMGSSPRWPSKAWAESELKKFIKLAKIKGFDVLLFGGPDEKERHKKFVGGLENEGIKILRNNPENSDVEFAALVNLCKFVVCSDSFALHIALALGKKTIGLFFCTSPDEVEGYDILEKVISPRIYDFFPQRMNEYSKELTESIKAEQVMQEINK